MMTVYHDSGGQSGRKCVSVEAALRAEQGLYTRNLKAIVSQRGPEYAVAVRARVGVTESHREPERDREEIQ